MPINENLRKAIENRKGQKRAAVFHTVRSADQGTCCVKLTYKLAVALFCTECLGFEADPKSDCTSPLCPLYPYRRRTRASQHWNVQEPPKKTCK